MTELNIFQTLLQANLDFMVKIMRGWAIKMNETAPGGPNPKAISPIITFSTPIYGSKAANFRNFTTPGLY
jgi:hypothetical protein